MFAKFHLGNNREATTAILGFKGLLVIVFNFQRIKMQMFLFLKQNHEIPSIHFSF
jgi:hypothetical protein